MKAVDVLVNSKLPPELRGEHTLDAKGIDGLMTAVATTHPEDYGRIAKDIGDIGRHAAYRQGATLSISDFTVNGLDKNKILEDAKARVSLLDKKDPQYKEMREKIWHETYAKLQRKLQTTLLRGKNGLGDSILSGARGNIAQLRAMVATPGLYEDAQGNNIPIYVQHSFAEGLRPAELLAGTYGARTSVISTKKNTAKGGDWGKQLTQAGAHVNITQDDCGTTTGIDLAPDDESLRGRVLLRGVDGVPAGTVIDKRLQALIRKNGKKVVVRSAITCGAPDGVCSQCVGKHFDNKFSKVGDAVGITAAAAVSTPVIQGGLNAKHTSGMSKGSKKEYAGFAYINQFTQVPKEFKDRASLAEEDGTVTSVEEAPQGGHYVTIGDTRHYVLAGLPVLVSPGDVVERGDELSEGFKSPADVVRLLGLGEGRRYFAEGLAKTLAASGQAANIKNTELAARGVLNNVIAEGLSEHSQYLPDEVVNYSKLAESWIPPETAKHMDVEHAKGLYLQHPVLHYTIGTKLTSKMLKRIKDSGVSSVLVSPDKPDFDPEMTRLRTTTHGTSDWLAALSTSYLKKQLLEAATAGATSNIRENKHFAPRLAVGEGFGERIHEKANF